MSLYELLLFVHVLAAAAWFGGIVIGVLFTELAYRAGDRAQVVRHLYYDDRLAPILYIPAALLVLAAGIGLVLEGPWGFGDGWVIVGLGVVALSFVAGYAVFLPAGKRLGAAVERHGAESDEAVAEFARLRPFVWADLGLLVIAIFVMTTKPF